MRTLCFWNMFIRLPSLFDLRQRVISWTSHSYLTAPPRIDNHRPRA